MNKEEAIKNHRAMWHWIADELEKDKPLEGRDGIKGLSATIIERYMEIYFRDTGKPSTTSLCYLSACSDCPLQEESAENKSWSYFRLKCLNGRYNAVAQATYKKEFSKAAKIAREIAELPEVR